MDKADNQFCYEAVSTICVWLDPAGHLDPGTAFCLESSSAGCFVNCCTF